jgi:hypothetical protein
VCFKRELKPTNSPLPHPVKATPLTPSQLNVSYVDSSFYYQSDPHSSLFTLGWERFYQGTGPGYKETPPGSAEKTYDYSNTAASAMMGLMETPSTTGQWNNKSLRATQSHARRKASTGGSQLNDLNKTTTTSNDEFYYLSRPSSARELDQHFYEATPRPRSRRIYKRPGEEYFNVYSQF